MVFSKKNLVLIIFGCAAYNLFGFENHLENIGKIITELEAAVKKSVEEEKAQFARDVVKIAGCSDSDIFIGSIPDLAELAKLRGIIGFLPTASIDVYMKDGKASFSPHGKLIGTLDYNPQWVARDQVSQHMKINEVDTSYAPIKIQNKLEIALIGFFNKSIAPRFDDNSIQAQAQRIYASRN